MLKLFVTVLAMSDTGSIATTAFTTDYYDSPVSSAAEDCGRAMADFNRDSNKVFEMFGHKMQVKVSADCRPPSGVEGVIRSSGQYQVVPEARGIPAPIRGMIEGLLDNIGRR